MTIVPPSISLTVPADSVWVPVIQAAAQNGADVFQLPSAKASRLVMGAEELLLYLSEKLPGKNISLTIRGGSTFVAAEFTFESTDTDLSAMNITTGPNYHDEDELTFMPLLLASRMTDGFHVERLHRHTMVTLKVDRIYPLIPPTPTKPHSIRGSVTITPTSDPAELMAACSATTALYSNHLVPFWCKTPGRVVDMVTSGELNVLVAKDDGGAICGMICWESPSKESIAFYGPYSFTEGKRPTSQLVESMTQVVARTSAKIIYSHISTENLSKYGFERLAAVCFHAPEEASPTALEIWSRQLREDFGIAVWSHPALVPYLERKYDELVLMRDIRPTSDLGERITDRSVFSAKLDRQLSEAILKPMLNGTDNTENLKRHVETLNREGFKNIFFQMDLSSGWQATLGGALLENGFEPVLLLPHGGQSDMVMFQYAPTTA